MQRGTVGMWAHGGVTLLSTCFCNRLFKLVIYPQAVGLCAERYVGTLGSQATADMYSAIVCSWFVLFSGSRAVRREACGHLAEQSHCQYIPSLYFGMIMLF